MAASSRWGNAALRKDFVRSHRPNLQAIVDLSAKTEFSGSKSEIAGNVNCTIPVVKWTVQSASYRAWKFIAIFYVMACGVSCVLWAPLVLGKNGLRLLKTAPDLFPWAIPGTLGPLVACCVTHRFETGNWRVVRVIPSQLRQICWIFLGPLLVFACVFLVFPALMSKGDPRTWHWHAKALAAIPGYMFGYNLLGGPLFEEFGWRGFLQSRLDRLLPPWVAAICVGTMWAVWHFPLFLVRGWTSVSPLVFLFIMIGLSFVMAFGFNASGQSIITAVLMHCAFNVSPLRIGDYLQGTALREDPAGDWLISCSFWLVGVVLLLLTHGSLGFRSIGEDDHLSP